jgi:hypothetical protein
LGEERGRDIEGIGKRGDGLMVTAFTKVDDI